MAFPTHTEPTADVPTASVLASVDQYKSIRDTIDGLINPATYTLLKSIHPTVPTFLPNIRSDLFQPDNAAFHATTTAQCLSALQQIKRTQRHLPIYEHQLVPDWRSHRSQETVSATLQNVLQHQLDALANPEKIELSRELHAHLSSTLFGELNPITSAVAFRTLTRSVHCFEDVWWTALFALLWALRRRMPEPHVGLSASVKDMPATAFVTAECIDAIECFILDFSRRAQRLERLSEVLRVIESALLSWERTGLKRYPSHVVGAKLLELDHLLTLFSWDASTKSFFNTARRSLRDKINKLRQDPSPKEVRDAIVEAFRDGSRADLPEIKFNHKYFVDAFVKPIKSVYPNRYKSIQPKHSYHKLPEWLKKSPYWPWDPESRRRKEHLTDLRLEKYWGDHVESLTAAHTACSELSKCLYRIVPNYKKIADLPKDPPISRIIGCFDHAQKEVMSLADRLRDEVEPAVEWCRTVVDMHIARGASNSVDKLDPTELAYSLMIVCQFGGGLDSNKVFHAIDAVAEAQLPDGSWPAWQPFFWNRNGSASYPHSVETASALVRILNRLLSDSHPISDDPEMLKSRVRLVETALVRFLKYLLGQQRQVPVPTFLRKPPGQLQDLTAAEFFGWGSERTQERDVISTWVTAHVIEFLSSLRTYVESRINDALLKSFTANPPKEFRGLDQLMPTDLDTPFKDRIQTVLYKAAISLAERSFLGSTCVTSGPFVDPPSTSQDEPGWPRPDFFSIVLSGPPGTSKTKLAQGFAKALDWPMLSLSPSDFLSNGQEKLEARSTEIFQSLMAGHSILIFFDEIDEMILSRSAELRDPSRSMFSFLTPSLLTKLQDLRNKCPKQSLVFVIATNFVHRIDPAAIRTGRIDNQYCVMYPDKNSRMAIALDTWLKSITGENSLWLKGTDKRAACYLQAAESIERATAQCAYTVVQDGAKKYAPDKLNYRNPKPWAKRVSKAETGIRNDSKKEIEPSHYDSEAAILEFASYLRLLNDDRNTRDEQMNEFLSLFKKKPEKERRAKQKLGNILSREFPKSDVADIGKLLRKGDGYDI